MTYIRNAPDQTLITQRILRSAMPDALEMREWLAYDPALKQLWWLKSPNPQVPPGLLAGYEDANGYTVIKFQGLTISAHRVLWALHFGEWPVGNVRFRNGNRRDLRIENLKLSSRASYQGSQEPVTSL